jgi:N-acetylglucosaminyldiphosphoundecaprenol N-acetyl-beta-D-mannosaminyltransferase
MMHLPPEFKNKVIILGVIIDDLTMEEAAKRAEQFLCSSGQHKIFTPNPEICLKAEQDSDYRHILNSASLNLPDGIGLQFGAKILNQSLNNRVPGSDFIKKLFQLANTLSQKVYVIRRNDSLSSADDIKNLIKRTYPNIILRSGTVNERALDNFVDLLNDINEFAPTILFVALGAPGQEIWINKYLPFLRSVKIANSVGGAIDFLTGKMDRAPKLMRDLGVEWLYRLYLEPSRLKRIKNATADFLLACHRWRLRIKNELRQNVLAVIINKEGKLLIIKNKRFRNHWQFPQGGIEAGEKPEEAVIREASEELGCLPKVLKVIKQIQETHSYIWREYSQLLKGYKGQRQTAFILQFNGTDKDIDLSKSQEAEGFQWVSPDEVINRLHRDRRTFARNIIRHIN